MRLGKNSLKKIIMVFIIACLGAYVAWDVSVRIVNRFRLQGYKMAVVEMIMKAENENCEPFSVFAEEKRVNLINIACFQNMGDIEDSE